MQWKKRVAAALQCKQLQRIPMAPFYVDVSVLHFLFEKMCYRGPLQFGHSRLALWLEAPSCLNKAPVVFSNLVSHLLPQNLSNFTTVGTASNNPGNFPKLTVPTFIPISCFDHLMCRGVKVCSILLPVFPAGWQVSFGGGWCGVWPPLWWGQWNQSCFKLQFTLVV